MRWDLQLATLNNFAVSDFSKKLGQWKKFLIINLSWFGAESYAKEDTPDTIVCPSGKYPLSKKFIDDNKNYNYSAEEERQLAYETTGRKEKAEGNLIKFLAIFKLNHPTLSGFFLNWGRLLTWVSDEGVVKSELEATTRLYPHTPDTIANFDHTNGPPKDQYQIWWPHFITHTAH